MQRTFQGWASYGLVLTLALSPVLAKAADPAKDKKPAAAADEHGHGEHGPHDGDLIELGEEEYHGEIVLDEKTETVIIYVLSSNAKDAVPIEATEVVINLKHGGKPEQFKLKATPQKSDPKGKSSCFKLKSDDLMHDLHHKDADPRLRLKIAGKTYTGKIAAADHDHADHAAKDKKKN